MRDDKVARRALLAFAAAALAGFWPAEPVSARAGKRRSKPPAKRLRTVVLDPGHGGVDPGAISPRGHYEKTIALAIARVLAAELETSRRYRVVMTRRRDVFVALRRRVARARAADADLLLSLHADALPDARLRGLSVYTLSEEASDHEAALLAERENKDDFVGGLRLSGQPRVVGAILLDLSQRQTNNQSLALATAIVHELGGIVPLLGKPQRAAGFAVLTAPDIPSVLVELGCLSNPDDERMLANPVYRRRLARGLVRSIDDYFAALAPA